VEAHALVSYLDLRYRWGDAGTGDVYHGRDTRAARATCPVSLWVVAKRKLERVHAAETLGELREPPGNRLERLTGNRWGQHSIRINRRFRICFRWTPEGAAEIEITDYH
jgi:toxin HigB-1